MAPKQTATITKVLLGRPTNNLKMGIVGLPNVGKSTFFNVLTTSSVAAENYPFCTIDPSESRVAVPDPRFDWLCETFKPASRIPAYLTVIDIAGLVRGASSGEGLGNSFLSHIRAVDGIFHMVRLFSDDSIAHVEGTIDPIRDIEIIHSELRLKDAELLSKQAEAARRNLRGSESDKAKKLEFDTILKALDVVSVQKKDIRHSSWTSSELLTAKSVVYLANLTPDEYEKKKNRWLPKVKEWIDCNSPGDALIPFSASNESSLLKSASPSPALSKIIVNGYRSLQLQHFFTAGHDEVRAWTIRAGSRAPQAAGVIHSDFEKGFIAAEVMKFEDLKSSGSESAVKAAGKYMTKGKEYLVEDGDIIFFKFNVAGKKK